MDLTKLTLILSVVYRLMRYTIGCPIYQVPHTFDGKTVCCLPVFNCREGHEVKYCTENGESDVCQRCNAGFVNWFNTSSFDTVKRSCFLLTRDHNYSCPAEDTYPTLESEPCENMRCKCQNNMCRFGDPCAMCTRATECGVNEEMNIATGECEPCKEMMYSPVGCAPCLYNETAWRISEEKKNNHSNGNAGSTEPKTTPKNGGYTITSDPQNKSTESLVENGGDGAGGGGGGGIIVPVVIAVVVLVIISLAFAFVLYAKKKANSGDTSSVPAVLYRRLCSSPQSNYETDAEASPSFSAPLYGNVPPQAEVSAGRPAAAVSPMVKGSEQGTSDGACMDALKAREDEQEDDTQRKY